MKDKITRVVVMDFDGTLVDTMTPDIGKPLWKKSTGFDWPHRGWWGREESLDMDVFGCKPIDKVIDAYKDEYLDQSTLMVMMTGRIPSLQTQVKAILNHCNLSFDEYLFNTGGPTLDYKLKQLNNFVRSYPNLQTMEIWEDRPEHTKVFKQWADDIREHGIDCQVNQV